MLAGNYSFASRLRGLLGWFVVDGMDGWTVSERHPRRASGRCMLLGRCVRGGRRCAPGWPKLKKQTNTESTRSQAKDALIPKSSQIVKEQNKSALRSTIQRHCILRPACPQNVHGHPNPQTRYRYAPERPNNAPMSPHKPTLTTPYSPDTPAPSQSNPPSSPPSTAPSASKTPSAQQQSAC